MKLSNLNKLYENPIKRHLVVGGVILFVIIFISVFSDYGLINSIKYNNKKTNLSTKVQQIKFQKDSLLELEQKLKYDTSLIEKIARERYGMIKDGETIYFIEKEEHK